MTDGELAAIEERCNAATPGPWNWNGDEIYGVHGDDVLSIEAIPFSMYGEQLYFGDGVLPFVLAARTDVPALIAEVRRLREALASIESLWTLPVSARDAIDYAVDVAQRALGESNDD